MACKLHFNFIFIFGIFTSLLCAHSEARQNNTSQRPNIILLLADDLSYKSVGFSGNSQVKTPQLDKLANDGVIFDRAYDTTAICMASRAQIFTGKYEFKTGTNFLHGAMSPNIWQDSYQVKLRESGYFTGFVGKFGFAVKDPVDNWDYKTNDDLPIDDFDRWYGWPSQGSYASKANTLIAKFSKQHPHTTSAVAAAAREFIGQAKQSNKPFLLSVSFKAPHKPFSPDPKFDHIYADTVWQRSVNIGEKGASHIPQQAKSGRQYRTMLDFIDSNYQDNMRKYNQLVYGVDVAVGMIRQQLEAQGLAENTVIIFLSDNGYSLGAHNMSGKVLPYEEPSRTPLVVYDPRITRAKKVDRSNSLVSNLDMAPTLFALANVSPPEHIDGHNLLPLLTDQNATVNNALMLIQAWGNAPTHSLAIVAGDYKYIYWPYAQDMPAAQELYHLTQDSEEMTNLANSPEYANQLRSIQSHYDAALDKWKNESVETGNYPVFADIFNRQLGWQKKLEMMPPELRIQYTDWQRIEREELTRKANRKKKAANRLKKTAQ